MKIISKKDFDAIPDAYKGVFSDYQGTHPEWKGRRTAFLPGEGTVLFTEGVHFLVDGDYSHLPALHKSNARVGDCYRFAGSYIKVTKVYRISEQYARDHNLYQLDRADFIHQVGNRTVTSGCGLPGSDILKEETA